MAAGFVLGGLLLAAAEVANHAFPGANGRHRVYAISWKCARLASIDGCSSSCPADHDRDLDREVSR
jgi:hypothetical protein